MKIWNFDTLVKNSKFQKSTTEFWFESTISKLQNSIIKFWPGGQKSKTFKIILLLWVRGINISKLFWNILPRGWKKQTKFDGKSFGILNFWNKNSKIQNLKQWFLDCICKNSKFQNYFESGGSINKQNFKNSKLFWNPGVTQSKNSKIQNSKNGCLNFGKYQNFKISKFQKWIKVPNSSTN